MTFRYLEDLTSDVAFEAKANSLEELLNIATKAMLEVMYDINEIEPSDYIEISVEAKNEEQLVHRWLSEVLFLIEVNNMFFSEIKEITIAKNDDKITSQAKLLGEEADYVLLETQVKGVTYHKFCVKQEKNMWIAIIVIDI